MLLVDEFEPVVGQTAGHLEGECTNGFARRFFGIFLALEIAHEEANHRRTGLVRQFGGKGALTNAGAGFEPEHAGSRFIKPCPGGIEQPLSAVKPLGLFYDARFEFGRNEDVFQALELAADAHVLRIADGVTHQRHALGEPGFPVLPIGAGLGASPDFAPVLKVVPLQMTDGQWWGDGPLRFGQHGLDVLFCTKGGSYLVQAHAGVTHRAPREEGQEMRMLINGRCDALAPLTTTAYAFFVNPDGVAVFVEF